MRFQPGLFSLWNYQPQGQGLVIQEGREFWIREAGIFPSFPAQGSIIFRDTQDRHGKYGVCQREHRELLIVADQVADQGSLVEKRSLPF